jgi:hypothetical protein
LDIITKTPVDDNAHLEGIFPFGLKIEKPMYGKKRSFAIPETQAHRLTLNPFESRDPGMQKK